MTKQKKDPITLGEWIEWAASRFDSAGLYFGHGTDNAFDEAAVLVLHVLRLGWPELESLLDKPFPDDRREALLELVDARITEKVPAAYLTGRAWFAGLEFIVNRHVLVPRSPIAELVINAFRPWVERAPARILDLCTGSGCIGIASATVFDDAMVDLSDISPEALEVARANIELHQLDQRVRAVQSDVFGNIAGKYDLIVANPPYVDALDLASMPDEYRAEPVLGLASGADGLDITRTILAKAGGFLNYDGLLVVEVGNSWEALEQAFPSVPFLWPEFEYGGHGVFLLSAKELNKYQEFFNVR